jgi:hypothetical protein
MGEYSKKMGEMWKELSEDEKKPYNVSTRLCHARWSVGCKHTSSADASTPAQA